jgi:hypothetical protein
VNRVTVRRFDVVRTANIVAAMYAVIVIAVMLVFLLPFLLIGGLAGLTGAGSDSGAGAAIVGAGVIGGLIFLVLGAAFYAVIGWVMTAIVVLIYNWLAGRLGGLQLDVQVDGPWPGGYAAYPGYSGTAAGPGYPLQAPGYPQPVPGQPQWPAPGAPGAPPQAGGGQGGPGMAPPSYPSGS